MLPPGVRADWEDNSSWMQALMISYSQIRTNEEAEQQYEYLSNLAKALH